VFLYKVLAVVGRDRGISENLLELADYYAFANVQVRVCGWKGYNWGMLSVFVLCGEGFAGYGITLDIQLCLKR